MKTRKPPGVRYPWERWLDGKGRTLTRGKHFDVYPHNLRNQAYRAAAKRGLRVVVNMPTDDTVWLQAIGKPEAAP